jgi:hypothetical protein
MKPVTNLFLSDMFYRYAVRRFYRIDRLNCCMQILHTEVLLAFCNCWMSCQKIKNCEFIKISWNQRNESDETTYLQRNRNFLSVYYLRKQFPKYLLLLSFYCSIYYECKKLKIGIFGGEVQLGPLGTAATNRPVVPATSDYDNGEVGGMMIGRRNRSTRRKSAPVPLCSPRTPHALPGREPGPSRWEASN